MRDIGICRQCPWFLVRGGDEKGEKLTAYTCARLDWKGMVQRSGPGDYRWLGKEEYCAGVLQVWHQHIQNTDCEFFGKQLSVLGHERANKRLWRKREVCQGCSQYWSHRMEDGGGWDDKVARCKKVTSGDVVKLSMWGCKEVPKDCERFMEQLVIGRG